MPRDHRIAATSFIAFDLEATGVAPGYDHIVEIAAVRFEIGSDGRVVPGEVFDELVRPGRAIPPPIARLTGIANEMVADAPPLEEVWPRFMRFLGASGRTSVALAHSARRDLALLTAEAANRELSWEGPEFICTFEMSRHVFPHAPNYKLESLVRWRGCAPDGSGFHRARHDALHTRNLFAELVKETRAETIGDLGVRRFVPLPEKGELVVEIPERLRRLEEAIGAERRLAIIYRGGSKGRQARPVTPLAFYAVEGALNLRAWCHLDDEAKSFRCQRIGRILGDEPVEAE